MAAPVTLYVMASLYILAGINHFLNPRWYLKIIPPWVPNPDAVNRISGACEILFGLLLFFPSTQIVGAWLIIALLIAVFPANIQMSINYKKKNHPYFWITLVRLPLQLVLIAWAWSYTR